MDAVRKVVETFWVGTLLFVALYMTWLMYHERPTGIYMAQHLFPAASFIGVVAGIILLISTIWSVGAKGMKALSFWIVVLMLLMSAINFVGVPALLVRFGMDANFKLWHAIGMIVYLMECALGVVLIVQRR
ncbi:hypothetical protein LIN78_01655 [Leeia sp. TBRC 13508]|uniref:DUF4149 domain-containing protein n=1 Tax=Leeia speluncae TaxID=2884804 RepID=A0ABS8D254_9NEIS|nr:hypothetical protein [Leeia speluncae]MCB6182262.1 hypothetical protein [Leeia speluncae]